MKKCVIFLVALFVTCSFCSGAFAKDLKIGYLNFLEVFNEYKKTKDYDEILNKKAEAKEKELKAKESEIEKMQSKLNVLKEKEKEKEQKNFEKAAQGFLQLKRQSLIDLKKEKDEKMKEIIEDIDKAIKDYSKKNNFDLVVHGSAVLYGNNAMDITQEILKIVNASSRK